jgi:superfamily I DNA and/or RNA helicase
MLTGQDFWRKMIYNLDTTAIDVLILDEISMVRADLINSIDRFLRINGKSCDKVFGGTQVIMIGDLFQLPPVVSEEEEATLFSRKYTSPYFFSAKALEEEIIAPVELTEVFRQQDDQFISILNRIRLGDCNDDVLNFINSRAIIAVFL